MNVPQFAVKRPVLVMVIFLVMTLFGLFSLKNLPLDLMPDMEIPVVSVITIYEGAGSEEVEEKITKVIESALSSVENLKDLHSQSMENVSMVSCEFEYGTDLAEATNSIRDKLSLAANFLPKEIDNPRIFKVNMSMMPIMYLSVTSQTEDIRFKAEEIEDFIQNPLERVPGVGTIITINAMEKKIMVVVDKQRLATLGLSVSDVSAVISAENLSLPGGYMQIGAFEYTLRVPGEFKDIHEVEETIVASTPAGIIRVKDIARVFWGAEDERQFAIDNGNYMVFMMVQKQSGANTVAVANSVKEKLEEMKDRLPFGMKTKVLMDNSEYIVNMVGNLSDSIFTACICVILVVVFFLRRIRSSLIVIMSIPASMIIAFAFLYGFHFTLNLVSLMALTLSVGMVVDNSIVVLDSITRHLELGESRKEATVRGASEVGGAIVASTLTTIVIFTPLFFVGGLINILFGQLAGVIILTLAASLLSAMLLTPMTCSRILKAAVSTKNQKKRRNLFFRAGESFLTWMEQWYSKVIQKSLNHKKATIAIALGGFLLSLLLIPFVGLDFMPEGDEGSLHVNFELPLGTRVEETLKVAQHIEKIMREEIPLKHLIRTYVRGGPNDSGMSRKIEGTNTGSVSAKLISISNRDVTTKEYADKIRKRVIVEIPGIEKLDFNTGGSSMGSSEKPVTIKLLNKDFAKNSLYAGKLQEELEKMPELSDVTNDADTLKPEIEVKVDRVRASQVGLKVSMIAAAVRYSFYGEKATVFRENGKEYDISVKYKKGDRETIEQLKELELKTMNGTVVKLKDVATIQEGLTSLVVKRLNRERMITVDANVKGNAAIGKVTSKIEKLYDKIKLPNDIGITYGGNIKNQRETTTDIVLMLLLGVVLVYLVMAAQFESFIDPFVIIFSIPFAVSGVLIGLLVSGHTLSLPALLGMVILVGIVVNNAIVLIDYTKFIRKRDSLTTNQALINAGGKRLRPILMTATTTIFGMIPLAVMHGEAAEIFNPMGAAVVGGLTISTLITLILIPCVYSLVDGFLVKHHLRSNKND